jgi:predicted HTH transcriptional regulator
MLFPKKNTEYIENLLKRPEGTNLDFKLHINNSEKIAKTLVAFANTAGGIIVIGVSDAGQIIGIDGDEEVFMMEIAASKFCKPPVPVLFELYEIEQWEGEQALEECYVLVVKVPKTGIRYLHVNSDGKDTFYIREGDKTLPK